MNTGNLIKTTFLLVALMVLFIALGQLVGGTIGMVIALVMALAMNMGAYWFSDRIALSMAGAYEAPEEEAPALHALVGAIAVQAGLPKPKVYLIEDAAPNAFATGRDPAHSAIAVTSGLMSVLSRDEVAGVLAHELAHIKNRDTLICSVVATIAGSITMIATMAPWLLMAGSLGNSDREEEGGSGIGGLVGTVLMMILAPIAAVLIQMAISRSREFEADALGAQIRGNPLPLARALEKLEASNRLSPSNTNPAVAHQYIINPLGPGGLANLFRTHPSTEDRVARLRQMALQP